MAYDATIVSRTAAGSSNFRHTHVVQFYENESYLYDAVTTFVATGLKSGQPAVVIAREESRKALASGLETWGLDFDAACRSGDLIVHDARALLSTFMRGSNIDEDRFMKTVGTVIQDSARGRRSIVRAFGEMVDILFRDGNATAAIRLEELWNDLSQRYSFDLLCAYALGNFYTDTHAHELKEICRRHSHIIPAESYAILLDEQARAHKVIELQQRARALQVEIEHRKAIERALREALAERQQAMIDAERANAAKNEFLAIISHELRTPLTAIIGYEELLQHGVAGPVSEQQELFLGGIRAGANHLLRLIEQILSQSRLSAGKDAVHKTNVDVSHLIDECVALVNPVASSQGLELGVHGERPLVCDTDEGKVQQITLNLLSNAVKFTPKGRVDIWLSADHADVVVEVRDTGVGIAAHDLEVIFEPFQQVDSTMTRAHSGIGLGLSVSRNLAQLLGGEITVTSEVGAGSAFRFTFPRF
jgi:signal transduction histidine kinase